MYRELDSNYKWNFIGVAYISLMIVFLTAISTMNGLVRLGAFLIAGLFFVFVTKRKRDVFFFFIALLLNSELLTGSFAGVSIQNIIYLCAAGYIFLYFLTRKKKKKIAVPFWFYAIWLLYIAFSQYILAHSLTLRGVISIAGMMCIGIALQIENTTEHYAPDKTILAVFVGFSFIVFVGYLELALGRTFFYSLWTGAERYRYGIMRVGSTVADPNNVCYYLVPFLFWVETDAVKSVIPPQLRKIVQLLAALMVILTSSRTGLVALVLGIVLYWTGKKKAILLLGIPILGFAFNYLLQVFEMLLQQFSESTNTRVYIVNQCMDIWMNHKLFGVGTNTLIDSLDFETNVMNTFVYMLAGMGIIGVCFYVFYWIILIKKDILRWITERTSTRDSLLKLASVLTMLVIAYTLDTFYMMLMWLIPAMLIAVDIKKQRGD